MTKTDDKVTKLLTPSEVAELEGVTRKTVGKWIDDGKIPAVQSKKGERTVWLIPVDYKKQAEAYPYAQFFDDWTKAQASGFLSGTSISPRAIQANHYGLKKFWQILGEPPSIHLIEPDILREALSLIPVDHEAENCHYSVRDQLYKAVMSAYKFLGLKGHRPKEGLEAFKPLKPTRKFPERRTVLPDDDFVALIQHNEGYTRGRKPFDVIVTRVLLYLMGCAGLRREEVCDLQVHHVDFKHGIIKVINGKGYKNRELGMFPVLQSVLQDWLQNHRPKVNDPHFLLTSDGSPVTFTVINHRIKRLSNHSGLDITPHGLRRTFATMLADMGMPHTYIQEALGHSDQATTQKYIMTSKHKMIDWLRTGGQGG